MKIRLSVPGLPDRETTLFAFAAEHDIGTDELLDIAQTLSGGFEWSGLYSNQHCSLVRINQTERVRA